MRVLHGLHREEESSTASINLPATAILDDADDGYSEEENYSTMQLLNKRKVKVI